ncbi:DUF721 domain-containing protein [Paracoccus sp. S-4012]|nr:DUF721 domain-containing protein [Paracoccus sp. S-4012]
MRGFETAAGLVACRVGELGEKRGFAVSRLLTHWAEVVGAETAARCRPVKISHSRGGFGGTLVLLTTGANAPRLEMELPAIRERVNACYGFNAVARIHLTQTAPHGFAPEPPRPAPARPVSPAVRAEAESAAAKIDDPGLAEAVARFARAYLSRKDAQNRGSP